MATNVNELIFIKRIKKRGHEASHDGAWKIAYADFVTAMMAFFLLMWLLNATTEDQRAAISNYFAPASVSESMSGSGGVMGGDRTINSEGAISSSTSRPGLMLGARTPVLGNADEESEDGEGEFAMSGPVSEHEFEGAAGSHMGTLEAHDQKQGTGSHLGTVEKNDAKNAKSEFLAHSKKKSGPEDKLGASNQAGPKQGQAEDGGKGAGRNATNSRNANESRNANQSRFASDRATPMIPATPREVVRNAKRSASPKPRKCSKNSSNRTRNSARSKIICASSKLALACASKFSIISKLRCSRLVAQR